MRLPAVLRSYFGNQEVFRLTNLRRTQDGGLTFDIKVAPRSSTPNILANPSFESGSGGVPSSWKSSAFQATAVFGVDTGVAKGGTRSA